MCRISGAIDFNGSAHFSLQDVGAKMRDSLAYGGPDDQGEFYDPENKLFLGHRRLSIIDTSAAGHQPMFYKNFVLVFNGEIYNYAEIAQVLVQKGYTFKSHSDTEVLLTAFDCWGPDAVNHFRGMFAFALWNRDTRKLLLCRDRVGVKPLYWYYKDGVFLFASELKAMHAFPGFDKTINHEAVSLFLQTGYIKAPYSIFQHAHKLEPGGFLEIGSGGEIKTWRYWKVDDIQTNHSPLTDQEVLAQAESLLTESCNYRMVSDVPVGIFLSGGVDSSLVTALLQKQSSTPLKTFTIGFENKDFDESGHARNIAQYLGTDHTDMICTADDFKRIIPLLPDMYDEPFGDSSAIPTHLVSILAREKVKVALSADGGDEVFSGYIKYQSVKSHYGKIKYLPRLMRKKMADYLMNADPARMESVLRKLGVKYNFSGLQWRLPKFANALTATDELNFFERASSYIPQQGLSKLHQEPPAGIFSNTATARQKDYLYSLLGKIDIATYLEGDILTKVDRASMSVALEGREPLLDHKLIEFGLSLPDQYKIRKGQTKWMLRNVLYKHVPRELIERPKQGFAIPVKDWLQQELRSDLLGLQSDNHFCELFSFNQAELKRLITLFLDPAGKPQDPHFIWFLYSLYRWYKRWM